MSVKNISRKDIKVNNKFNEDPNIIVKKELCTNEERDLFASCQNTEIADNKEELSLIKIRNNDYKFVITNCNEVSNKMNLDEVDH